MKTKVIIENGVTQIDLTPENDFEKDVIEKLRTEPRKYNTKVDICAKEKDEYGYSSGHKILVSIIENERS